MTTLALPNDIINQTPADATGVDQNYTVIEQYINGECITRDGSVAMTAPLQLVGDPTQANHAATKDYVDAILPVGIILPFAGVTAPAGSWALCNGATLTEEAYPELFAVVAGRFGTAPLGTFLLPNLQGRMPIGVDASQTDINSSGDSGGTTVPPLKTHTHPIDHNHASFPSAASPSMTHTHSIDHNHASVNTGAGGAHAHELEHRSGSAPGTLGRPLASTSAGTNVAIGASVMDLSVTHTHTVDLPPFDGLSGPGDLGTHTHAIDVPNFDGVSGAPVEAVVTAYRPPFLAITFIIRVR